MNNTTRPDDETYPDDVVFPGGDEPMVAISAESLRTTIETLTLFEQFFRHHASNAVHTELRTFCTARGWHGVCAAEALLDSLGFDAFALRHALNAAEHTDPQQGRA